MIASIQMGLFPIMGAMSKSGDEQSCSLNYKLPEEPDDAKPMEVVQSAAEWPTNTKEQARPRHDATPDTSYSSQAQAQSSRPTFVFGQGRFGSSAITFSKPTSRRSSSSTCTSATSAASNDAFSRRTDDVLSESSTAASIKRSFDILKKMEPHLDKHIRRDPPNFFPGMGGGMYTKKWTQEEKDSLIAFANKHILGKRAERDEERREEERSAKKRRPC